MINIALILTLAWRNLWRNLRRTTIMLAAITVGVWAMIFLTALMRGMVEDMLKRGLYQLPGHVQIHHPFYLDDPSIVNSLEEPSEVLTKALEEVSQYWFSRVKVPAMLVSERGARGVMAIGLDPNAESDILFANRHINEGRFLSSIDDEALVIGAKLAERLETGLGKRVVLMSQDPNNTIAERGFRIVGIFSAELSAQEEINIYVGKKTLQELLSSKDKISEIALFAEDYQQANTIQQYLQQILSEQQTKAQALSWKAINPYLSGMVNMMDGFVLVWVIVIFLAMSFGLANTLVMALYERIREIGLMLALGMAPMMVIWQILVESVILLLIGLALGNGLALVAVQLTAPGIDLSSVAKGLEMAGMGTTLYPALLIKDVWTANFIVLVLGMLTSVLPALRAAHYDPIRAITKST